MPGSKMVQNHCIRQGVAGDLVAGWVQACFLQGCGARENNYSSGYGPGMVILLT